MARKRKLTLALVVGSGCLLDAQAGKRPVTDGKELARIDCSDFLTGWGSEFLVNHIPRMQRTHWLE
jgi:hypothetical protein